MKIFLQLLVCIYLNFYSARKCKETAELYLENPYKPVYDIVHRYTKRIALHTPDCLLLVASICVVMKYLFLLDNTVETKFHTNITCLLYSLLLRSVVTRLTIIPTCMPKPSRNADGYSQMFLSTHDLMFSGHAVSFVFLGKIFEEEYYTNMYFYFSGKTIQFIFPITSVLSRQHYTNDVIVSMIVYNLFYQINT